MKRRQAVLMLGFGITSAAAALAQSNQNNNRSGSKTAMEYFKELFEISQKENKGITLWINGGQTVGGGVVKFNADTVEMKSQQYRRIVVRIAAIEAAAMM